VEEGAGGSSRGRGKPSARGDVEWIACVSFSIGSSYLPTYLPTYPHAHTKSPASRAPPPPATP
jgi:hypothetical protein